MSHSYFWKKEVDQGTKSFLVDANENKLGELNEISHSKWMGRGYDAIAEAQIGSFRWRFQHKHFLGILDIAVGIRAEHFSSFQAQFKFRKFFGFGTGRLIATNDIYRWKYNLALNPKWVNASKTDLFLFDVDYSCPNFDKSAEIKLDAQLTEPISEIDSLMLTLGWYLVLMRNYQERTAAKDLAIKTTGKILTKS